ncbi:Phage terminase, small subunit [compost metagenome]
MTKRAPGGGRKAKPTALKVLQGNPGKRGLKKDAPAPPPLTEVPEPPEWLADLGPWGVEAWEAVAPWLTRVGILTSADHHNLEAFCAAYQRWRMAEQEIAREGLTVLTVKGDLKKNPACTVANESLRQIASFGAALGLDPSSRARLIGGGAVAKPENPFLVLKGGRAGTK